MGVSSVTRKVRSQVDDRSLNGQAAAQAWEIPYDIVVDDPTTTETAILSHGSVVKVGDAHPDNSYLRVIQRRLVRVAPTKYELVAGYGAPGGAGTDVNPLALPPEIEFDAIAQEEAIDEDIDGKAIIMRTGEEFSPRITELVYIPVLRVRRNVAWIDPYTMATYRNATNSDTWYGMPPGTVKVARLVARRRTFSALTYWEVDGEFHMKLNYGGSSSPARAWWKRVLAQGFKVNVDDDLLGFGYVTVHAFGKDGKPVTKPVLHDIETGYEITDNTEAQWYEFQTKPSLPFSALGLL